jgi:hypothetical protein
MQRQEGILDCYSAGILKFAVQLKTREFSIITIEELVVPKNHLQSNTAYMSFWPDVAYAW